MANVSVGENGLLGYLAWWSIKDGQVSHRDLENAFQVAGLSTDFMPNEIGAGRAFKRALSKMEKASNSGEKYRGIIPTKVSEDKTRIVFTIHERTVDDQQYVDITQADRIVFNKDAGYIDYGHGKYTDQIRDFLSDCQTYYTANDIRGIVCRLVKEYAGAMNARERGAVYFVPHYDKYRLDRIDELVKNTLGGGIMSFPVFEEKKFEIGSIATDEMKNEFDGILQSVISALGDAKQKRVFENRYKELEKYEHRLTGYADLLNFKADELLAKVKGAKESMKIALGQSNDF